MTVYVCSWCRKEVPWNHPLRTLETPPNRQPLPVGSGWSVCRKCAVKYGLEVFNR